MTGATVDELIIQDGQRTYNISGRIADVVRYLVKRMDIINSHKKMRIELNCGEGEFQVHYEIFEGQVAFSR